MKFGEQMDFESYYIIGCDLDLGKQCIFCFIGGLQFFMFLCIYILVRVNVDIGYEIKEGFVREGRGVEVGVIGFMGCKSRKEVIEGGGYRGGQRWKRSRKENQRREILQFWGLYIYVGKRFIIGVYFS